MPDEPRPLADQAAFVERNVESSPGGCTNRTRPICCPVCKRPELAGRAADSDSDEKTARVLRADASHLAPARRRRRRRRLSHVAGRIASCSGDRRDRARSAVRGGEEATKGIRAGRQGYVDAARSITDDSLARIQAGEDVETVAREAVDARNALKVSAREDMPGILRSFAERRNLTKYGNPVGPTYEDLLRGGKTPEQIIFGAGRTSQRTNRLLGVR